MPATKKSKPKRPLVRGPSLKIVGLVDPNTGDEIDNPDYPHRMSVKVLCAAFGTDTTGIQITVQYRGTNIPTAIAVIPIPNTRFFEFIIPQELEDNREYILKVAKRGVLPDSRVLDTNTPP